MTIHTRHRFRQHIINGAYFMVIASSRISLQCSITFILALMQIGLSADASQTVHITNYNVSSLNGPSTYYQSMTLKNAADTVLPSHPSSLPLNTQKLATSDLTRDFDVQLKSIESNEMLVDTIQYAYNSLEQALSDHNDTRAFNQIAGKIEVKLSTAMRIVSETNQRILGILSDAQRLQGDHLFLDTIVMPSSPGWPLTKHSERRALDTNDVNVNTESNSSTGYVSGSANVKSIEILNFLKNAGQLHQTNDKNFTINRRIVEILKEIDYSVMHVPNIRDAFFIPSHKYAGNDNCRNKVLCAHHRYLYASSVKWRNVIMVIDSGYTADEPHALDVVKAFAQSVLDLLNESDSLKIISISNNIRIMNETKAFTTMNSKNKSLCRQFIESLEKCAEATNHTLAFEYAFKWARAHFEGDSSESMRPLLLYISRGYISNKNEVRNVLTTIAAGQSRLKQRILLNTCAIALPDETLAMSEIEYLTDVANQNYSKYGLTKPQYELNATANAGGQMYLVDPIDRMKIAAAAITNAFYKPPYLNANIIVHKPFYDATINDQIISITKSCETYGIVGVSVHLSDIAEDLTYFLKKYPNGDQVNGFLCDRIGSTIWHSTFPRNPQINTHDMHYTVNIKYFEKLSDEMMRKILLEKDGIDQISQWATGNIKQMRIYKWRKLSDWYIICMVRIESNLDVIDDSGRVRANEPVARKPGLNKRSEPVAQQMIAEGNDKLAFHRLDTTATEPILCQYFKHVSIIDTPTLYLSPKSFKSPFQHLQQMCEHIRPETKQLNLEQCFRRIDNIMAYIKDTTNLLTNPGLHPHVRNEVLTLSHFIDMLQKKHKSHSKNGKYIIRRYVTSMNGIVLMYPGFTMPNDFDPTRRIWFQKTIQNSGKLTITTPYLDVGGAGFVVTISAAIFENVPTPAANQDRAIAAIVSIDVTIGFIYQVLMQSSDYCRSDKNVKCFLIDDMGYIVVHPTLLEPRAQIFSDDMQFTIDEHITHREPFVAGDILLHNGVAKKKVCQNLLTQKMQRYYKYNLAAGNVLTNIVNGERTKYQIGAIPDSNIFAVLLNYTSEIRSGTVFCPCSTVDKVCFNCKRIESMSCECPCECPIDAINIDSDENGVSGADQANAFDTNDLSTDEIEICDRLTEEYVPDKEMFNRMADTLNGLNQCVNFSCEQYTMQMGCLGIVGCEWCQIDIDGETDLVPAFCTLTSSCFAGRLASNTPYGVSDIGADAIDAMMPSAFTIYPLAFGAIIVLIFIVGFGLYCYRQSLEPGSEQLYAESIAVEHNSGLPLTRLDYDSITPQSETDRNSNIGGSVSDASPYHIPGGFRRPNGESDHGYSTMTPHDDSDHVCFTLVEPLINDQCGNRVLSDNAITLKCDALQLGTDTTESDRSVNSPRQSYSANDTANITMSSPHHIQAPVTVHHPMEAIL